MKTTDFERLYNNFINKAESKAVDYSTLNREDKIQHLVSVLNLDTANISISTTKEMEIEKLSKDLRFQLIQDATAAQDFELIAALATGRGLANVSVTLPFEKSSIAAQLNYLEREYLKDNECLPTEVTVDILGGENFKEFIRFCAEKLNA